MTTNVIEALNKIKDNQLFNDDCNLYFAGGTALSYYLEHRVSEDIDIISDKLLKYKSIIPLMQSLGAIQIQDENAMALRMAGLFPNEYMLKFNLDGVKLEFFSANRPIQKDILINSNSTKFDNSNLNILDLKSIAKLKIVALLERDKSRDLFDFGIIIDKGVLTQQEILTIANQTKDISSMKMLYDFINSKDEPKEDEAVYLSEDTPINLSFNEIKNKVLSSIKLLLKS